MTIAFYVVGKEQYGNITPTPIAGTYQCGHITPAFSWSTEWGIMKMATGALPFQGCRGGETIKSSCDLGVIISGTYGYVLPAPPLPRNKAIRTDALFHGQHILPRDCASTFPPQPSHPQSPTSLLNLHGGRIISIRPTYFVSTALSHIS